MLIGLTPSPKKSASAAPEATADIYDVTTVDFETKIMQASMVRPILIDFWAPWCGPCKQLGPLLEQAVQAQGGKVALAKIDIDQNPQLAQAFRVQSIPTVVAFYMGQPVTAFAGARPKAEIDAIIAQLIQMHQQNQPDALDIPAALKHAADCLAASDLAQAQQLYAAVMAEDENNVTAYVGLVRVMIAAGQPDQAQLMIDTAPDLIRKDKNFSAAQMALDIARAAPGDDLASLQAAMENNPQDPGPRFTYAEACAAKNLKNEAVDALIQIIRTNRAWEEDKARKQLLKFFEAWGVADPASVAGRKRLSAVLFS